jgi:hypothetical protein
LPQLSNEHFWRENLAPGEEGYDVLCPWERRHRDVCPLVVACQPLYACKGRNTCYPGYDDASPRCSKCAKQYYRWVGCPKHGLRLLSSVCSAP